MSFELYEALIDVKNVSFCNQMTSLNFAQLKELCC